MLLLGQLYTDDTNNDDENNTNDDDNDTRWTNQDCIGSLACIQNEPKTSIRIFSKRGLIYEWKKTKKTMPKYVPNSILKPKFPFFPLYLNKSSNGFQCYIILQQVVIYI